MTRQRVKPLEARPAQGPAPGLREAREAARMSLSELAAATGYPLHLLTDLENGRTEVHRLVTSRISAVLGTTKDAVRGGLGRETRISDVMPNYD